MEYLSSLYIDNELELEDKILFIENVRSDKSFSDEALELLQQEMLLRSDPVYQTPVVHFMLARDWKRILLSFIRPIGFTATGFALAIFLMISIVAVQKDTSMQNRFLIYRPDARQAEIAGTFTGWKKIPLKKIGNSGYWEISLRIPTGEHRYTYILEGDNRFLDPTILERETDDFGGENSILQVGSGI